jgi:hypothetical protein
MQSDLAPSATFLPTAPHRDVRSRHQQHPPYSHYQPAPSQQAGSPSTLYEAFGDFFMPAPTNTRPPMVNVIEFMKKKIMVHKQVEALANAAELD